MSKTLADGRCRPSFLVRVKRLLAPLAVAASALGGVAAVAAPAPLQACFVYVSPIGQAGWTFQHELGRREMAAALGPRVTTRVVEAVAEGPDGERVMRDFAASGCGLVFATSFGYLDGALRVAADHPSVKFEHAGGYRTAANLATYNARHYEARWLAGWLAGATSRKGVAGYVAGFPVPEVLQGLNAFTLGMRAANPQAEVKVLWLNSWFDPARERDAALALVAQGADVLTHHTASPAVPQAAEAAGVDVIPYHGDMRAFAPTRQLAATTHLWGRHYTERVRAALDGRWSTQAFWGGLKDGTVALTALRPGLPADVTRRLDAERAALVAGRRHVFAAPLLDAQGKPRLERGHLDDGALGAMDWLVQGVTGGLPAGAR